MDFKFVSDKELLLKTKKVVKEEKKLTLLVLEHLLEIEQRKLYVDLNYSSMFSYCMKELGFSENETGPRISAMRLMRKFAPAKVALAQGELSLTTAAMAFNHIQQEEKEIGFKFDEG